MNTLSTPWLFYHQRLLSPMVSVHIENLCQDTDRLVLLGLVASGGSDRMVYVYEPTDTKEALYTLVGHSENVCCLTTSPGGDIISGSWDK